MRSSDPEELDAFLEAHKPIASPATFNAGDELGGWRITAFIGKGGSGEVYRAEHVASGTVAAIKIYIPRTGMDAARNASARARFLKEEKFLAENTHPSFPRFLGFGECGDRPWYAMELLEEKALPTRDVDVARFIIGVAGGVRHLHSIGLVHRDIKPGNILWRTVGSRVSRDRSVGCDAPIAPCASIPVLVDFGLLKDTSATLDQPGDTLSIIDGKAVVVGTPRYAAPEQLNGDEITPATDVYALGMLANECFGGRPPRAWARIIRRATAAIPAQRYSSIDGFVSAVRLRHLARWLVYTMAVLALLAVSPWVVQRKEYAPSSPHEDAIDRRPALEGEEVETNRVVTLIRLEGGTNVFTRPLVLDPAQECLVVGPGVLDAAVEGPKGATMRLRKCVFLNRTKASLAEIGVRYILDGNVYLNFSEIDRNGREEWSFVKGDYAYNKVRYRGLESVAESDEERRNESLRRMRHALDSLNSNRQRKF